MNIISYETKNKIRRKNQTHRFYMLGRLDKNWTKIGQKVCNPFKFIAKI